MLNKIHSLKGKKKKKKFASKKNNNHVFAKIFFTYLQKLLCYLLLNLLINL